MSLDADIKELRATRNTLAQGVAVDPETGDTVMTAQSGSKVTVQNPDTKNAVIEITDEGLYIGGQLITAVRSIIGVGQNEQENALVTASAIESFGRSLVGLQPKVFDTISSFGSKPWSTTELPTLAVIIDGRTSAEIADNVAIHSDMYVVHQEEGEPITTHEIKFATPLATDMFTSLNSLYDVNFMTNAQKAKLEALPTNYTSDQSSLDARVVSLESFKTATDTKIASMEVNDDVLHSIAISADTKAVEANNKADVNDTEILAIKGRVDTLESRPSSGGGGNSYEVSPWGPVVEEWDPALDGKFPVEFTSAGDRIAVFGGAVLNENYVTSNTHQHSSMIAINNTSYISGLPSAYGAIKVKVARDKDNVMFIRTLQYDRTCAVNFSICDSNGIPVESLPVRSTTNRGSSSVSTYEFGPHGNNIFNHYHSYISLPLKWEYIQDYVDAEGYIWIALNRAAQSGTESSVWISALAVRENPNGICSTNTLTHWWFHSFNGGTVSWHNWDVYGHPEVIIDSSKTCQLVIPIASKTRPLNVGVIQRAHTNNFSGRIRIEMPDGSVKYASEMPDSFHKVQFGNYPITNIQSVVFTADEVAASSFTENNQDYLKINIRNGSSYSNIFLRGVFSEYI